MNLNWTIEYDNDTGPGDGGFWEWWTVTNGTRSFKCDDEADAKWLAELLNAQKPYAEDFRTLPDSRQYEPEKLIVPKDTIYAAESALKAGIGYTKSVAAMLNEIPVPTYLDDRMLDMLGTDIRNMEIALEAIKKAAASDRIG